MSRYGSTARLQSLNLFFLIFASSCSEQNDAFLSRRQRKNPVEAAQVHLRPPPAQKDALSLLGRMSPRDREATVATMQAHVASILGSTAYSASEKANAKSIRTVKRNISKLGDIPRAVDSDGEVVLDSDGKELDGEDPDAAKRASFTAQLVPLNAEATRIGKEKKKAATALFDFIGVAVMAKLEIWNRVEL